MIMPRFRAHDNNTLITETKNNNHNNNIEAKKHVDSPRTKTNAVKKTTILSKKVSDRQLAIYFALLVVGFWSTHAAMILLRMAPEPPPSFVGHLWKRHPSSSTDKSISKMVNTTTSATTKTASKTTTKRATHKIPKVLIFTHYRDLLHDTNGLQDQEEIVLSANIQNSIQKHKRQGQQQQEEEDEEEELLVRFLTDEDCVRSLTNVFPSLIPFFLNETKGMFKADICRGSALYESGGIYLDVDVGVRNNLWQGLLASTEFVTSRVHRQSQHPNNFFQAVLGAAPKSPILYQYLQLFFDHYTGKEPVSRGPLGVILLRRAWDRVYNTSTGLPATELYQEVLYNPKIFPDLHPAPIWGSRRACHFVVVAPAHSQETTELTIQGHAFQIPLYSRIEGSRMCPKQDDAKNDTDTN